MIIVVPDALLSPSTLSRGVAVAFEREIVALGSADALRARYPHAELIEGGEGSLLMPGLINAHVHLEFGANRSTLTYGGFLPWLYSVMTHRDTLMLGCDHACMSDLCDTMLRSGITTFGAISSRGLDLQACSAAKQKVVFFNELIGSQASMADALYGDFLQRLEACKSVTREGFYSAIAIHSPYAVHPALMQRALELAKTEGLHVSAHFLESRAELEWLESGSGAFKPFFAELLKQHAPHFDPESFLSQLRHSKALLTHGVHTPKALLSRIAQEGHTLIHCPISNRLLGNGALDLSALDDAGVPWLCATDGLSSNYTLDLFEELKIALFMHHDAPLLPLAQQLLQSVTCKASAALGLNTGSIEEGKAADLLLLKLDYPITPQLPLHLLLQPRTLQSAFINGTKVL